MASGRRIGAKTQILQVKIQLREVRPPVWRRVLVPGEMSLAELHQVVQTAMGWTDSHLHEFGGGRPGRRGARAVGGVDRRRVRPG